jgi:hypothetical protein
MTGEALGMALGAIGQSVKDDIYYVTAEDAVGWSYPLVKRLHGQTTMHYFEGGRSICPRRYSPGRQRRDAFYPSLAVAPGAGLHADRRAMRSCARCRAMRERKVGVADA